MRAKEFIIEGYKEVAQKYITSGAVQSQVKTAIDKFKEIVNKNQASGDQRNIDWWGKNKSFDEFDRFVKSIDLERTKTQVKRQKVVGDSINLLENDRWLVVIPLTKDASCFHGKNTDWCTAKPNQSYFDEYFAEGVTLIYCINKQNGGKWAIAASPRYDDKMGLFDENDNSLTKKQFQQQTGMNPIELVQLASKNKSSIETSRKTSIMRDPRRAYKYARDVIGGRWPEGEKVIASDPTWATEYARNVIGGRFPEGEKVIASDPALAYSYARDVLNDQKPKTWRQRYLAGKTK